MKVAICAASERFTRLLRHLLVHECRVQVVEEPAQAEVFVLDWDGVGATETLEQLRQRWPQRPVLLLALNPPGCRDLPWLRKPLQAGALRAALGKLQPGQRRQAPAAEAERPLPATPGVNAADVGAPPPPATLGVDEVPVFRHYDPDHYLQGLLTQACRQALTTGIVLRLETGWEPILIFPRQRAVWVDADDKKLRAFCRLSLQTFCQLSGESGQAPAIVPDPAVQLQDLPSTVQRLDAFLWKVAWWNAAGRLPVAIAPHRRLRLKRWPNLTRYRHPPVAVRVAAAWFRQDMSPAQLATALGERGAVGSFVSAAAALGLVEAVQATVEEVKREVPAPPEGLLKRILRRLQRAA